MTEIESVKKLLWLGNVGDYSSFSRISSSILPELKQNLDITLLTAAENKIPEKLRPEVKIVRLGSDTTTTKWYEFRNNWEKTRGDVSLECKVKYTLVQIADLIQDNHFDYLLLCNGIYETNWLMELIIGSKISDKNLLYFESEPGNFKRTKVIVWTPIDYVPTLPVVNYVLEADYLITMTPVIVRSLKRLEKEKKIEGKEYKTIIDWVGHGTEIKDVIKITKDFVDIGRKKLIKKLNKFKGNVWKGSRLDQNDTIILNANNYVDRKRLDITLNAFIKFSKKNKNKNIKLWIHTNMKKFSITKEQKQILGSKIILSHNNVSDEVLSMIYKTCQIGLQTSTGEGWSLTNCEHAMFGALQIVPDFLATGFHFSDGKGLLIPVEKTQFTNEADHKTTIGLVTVDDTVEKISEAIKIVTGKKYKPNQETIDYVKSYTWKDEADKLLKIITSS